MPLSTYISNSFSQHLNTLQFTSCKVDMESRGIEPDTRFFGGREWCDYEINIAAIAPAERKYFCFCLFTMSSADENMYTHFRQHYQAFQRATRYPKFGWCGFGPHVEKPRFLLEVPIMHGIDVNSITDDEIAVFLDSQFNLGNNIPLPVDVLDFFRAMVNDPDFTADCDLFNRLKQGIIERIQ